MSAHACSICRARLEVLPHSPDVRVCPNCDSGRPCPRCGKASGALAPNECTDDCRKGANS